MPVSSTTKGTGLVAVALPTSSWMGPVLAPVGTEVTSWVAVAEMTLATVPLKLTVSEANVVLKP